MNYTYIKKGIGTVMYDYRLDPENYNIGGYSLQDYMSGKWIEMDEEHLQFKETNPSCTIKEWLEMSITPSYHPSNNELIKEARQQKLNDIEAYDKSSNVDSCCIVYGGQQIIYWKKKDERMFLQNAVNNCMEEGEKYYRLDLRELGISIEVDCETLLKMLRVLEVYAVKCYNKTTDHKFAVEQLTTVEEIKSYDHTSGYPEMPIFNL